MASPSLPGSYDGGVGSTNLNSRRRLVDAELVASVAWLIKLRWIAGLGVLQATWVVEAAFRLDAATGPLVVIGAAILAYYLVFFLWNRHLVRTGAPTASYEQLAKWQVGLDWLAVTLLIHYSGGIESPVILFFMFHIIIASMLFPQRTAFAFALLAIGLMAHERDLVTGKAFSARPGRTSEIQAGCEEPRRERDDRGYGEARFGAWGRNRQCYRAAPVCSGEVPEGLANDLHR